MTNLPSFHYPSPHKYPTYDSLLKIPNIARCFHKLLSSTNGQGIHYYFDGQITNPH